MARPAICIGAYPSQLLQTVSMQDVTQPVVGYRLLCGYDRIHQLENIFDRGVFDDTKHDAYHDRTDNSVFQLMKGEVVNTIIYVSDTPNKTLKSVKFVTNYRTSERFGLYHDSLEVAISIPDRYTLNGVYITKFGSVGAVAWLQREGCSSSIRESASTGLRTYALDVKAFVIECDQTLVDIAVLSHHAYDRFAALQALGVLTLSRYQHLLVLVQDEMVQSVDHVMQPNSSYVAMIRFKTDRRVSQWFGGAATGPVITRDCGKEPNAHICGFNIIGKGFVQKLKPIIAHQQSMENSKDASAWVVVDT